MKDPNLRRCSHAARGVWVDMLCLMFECSPRGVLITGSSPWSRDDVAAAVGGNVDVARGCVDELVAKGVCGVREDGALFNRRMMRDDAARVMNAKRVSAHREKQRCNAECNGGVTPSREDEDENEDHPKSKIQRPPLSTAEGIYSLYPRKVGRVAALKAITKILSESEPEMELKLAERTAAYAEAVKRWPIEELQFVPHPATWFNRGSFDDDPATWVRQPKNGHVPPARLGQNLTE